MLQRYRLKWFLTLLVLAPLGCDGPSSAPPQPAMAPSLNLPDNNFQRPLISDIPPPPPPEFFNPPAAQAVEPAPVLAAPPPTPIIPW